MPVFGSPPEKWDRLSEVVEKVGMPGAFGTIVVGLHDEPVTLLLALTGLTVVVRVIDPVAGALGTGVVEKIRRAFDGSTQETPRRTRAGRRTSTRPSGG